MIEPEPRRWAQKFKGNFKLEAFTSLQSMVKLNAIKAVLIK
jgi:hypothetical protein